MNKREKELFDECLVGLDAVIDRVAESRKRHDRVMHSALAQLVLIRAELAELVDASKPEEKPHD